MKVMEAAKYICNYSDIEVDNLKLQKLLYYSQAVSLVLGNRPLFDDCIEAWDYGPVVRVVYDFYKDCSQLIEKKEELVQATPEELNFIDMTIGYYGNMTGSQLINLTHSESPWINAYAQGRNTEITKDAIRDFYKNIYSYAS